MNELFLSVNQGKKDQKFKIRLIIHEKVRKIFPQRGNEITVRDESPNIVNNDLSLTIQYSVWYLYK